MIGYRCHGWQCIPCWYHHDVPLTQGWQQRIYIRIKGDSGSSTDPNTWQKIFSFHWPCTAWHIHTSRDRKPTVISEWRKVLESLHMVQSRKMCKILFPVTKWKHNLNVMKASESVEKLEKLCVEKIFQNQFHTKIWLFPMFITSTWSKISKLCIEI